MYNSEECRFCTTPFALKLAALAGQHQLLRQQPSGKETDRDIEMAGFWLLFSISDVFSSYVRVNWYSVFCRFVTLFLFSSRFFSSEGIGPTFQEFYVAYLNGTVICATCLFVCKAPAHVAGSGWNIRLNGGKKAAWTLGLFISIARTGHIRRNPTFARFSPNLGHDIHLSLMQVLSDHRCPHGN